jgi:Holliday junction resolvasome RuvABC endonuclease subunit
MIWGKGEEPIGYHLLKTPSTQEVIIRIREIIARLSDITTGHKAVVVESLPYGANSTSVRPLAALYYFIHNMCIDLSVEFHEANVTAVKKFATGKGSAKKTDMIQAFMTAAPTLYADITKANIRKTTGLADLADAYFIGKYHRRNIES